MEKSALCGGNLPRGAPRCSTRRIRNLKARKGLELQVGAKTLLLGPFQFVHNFLAQLREKVDELQARRFSSRTTLGIGEEGRRALGGSRMALFLSLEGDQFNKQGFVGA